MRHSVSLLALGLIVWLAWAPVAHADDGLQVYYEGPAEPSSLRQALALAPELEITPDPDQADVLVLEGRPAEPAKLAERVRQAAGLVWVLGPQVTAEDVSQVLGVEVGLSLQQEPVGLVAGSSPEATSLARQVVWASAPQVRERFRLDREVILPLASAFEDGSAVLGQAQSGRGQAFLLLAFLGEANPQFQDWAYFNYLMYYLVVRAADRTPEAFADFSGSPVPHESEGAALFLALGGMLLLSLFAFWRVRRYSLAHPEALEALVADRQRFAAREAATGWEEVGFHRPLGGFLFAFMFGLVMFIPLIVYQNLILPTYILPSAQALGIWGRVVQFFNLLWVLFDMGTSSAFIRFFAQDRVRNPRRAVQYGQVFVWWQALSGAIQVALVSALAGTLLPRTSYALYAWSVIVHTLIQLPGFYQVFRHALTGLQRFDYAQVIDMAWAIVFPIITQPVLVTLFVLWGRAHPAFGMAMGGVIGLGVAAYATEALTFLLGWLLYRRLGLGGRLLFLAHFDWELVKNALRFGVFDMLASMAWMVGQAFEILVTQRLVNYAEVWGNWTIAQNFIYAYQVLSTLYNNLVPAISEAISHARRALSQFYAAMAYKWGGLTSAFIGAVLLAVADRFILGATGPEFVRAASYATPLILWGAIQYPSWVGDNVQLGANRPYLKTALVAGEQALRVTLAFLLLARLQVYALVIAYFIGLLTKDIVAYFVNDRVCFRQRFFFWQSLAAPALAGLAHYAFVRWLGGLVWQGDQVTSVLMFLLGILPSFPVFALLYGLFGGWEDEGLDELRRAVGLSGFMRPLAWVFWRASVFGSRLSPLHGRFPISIRAAAMAEASSLTLERVSL
ncbi:MAG: hypothetical protein AB1449_01420 [Chloroflexota bacterium]